MRAELFVFIFRFLRCAACSMQFSLRPCVSAIKSDRKAVVWAAEFSVVYRRLADLKICDLRFTICKTVRAEKRIQRDA